MSGINGELKETCGETQVEWKIADFFSLSTDRDSYRSSTFSFANVSWYLEICALGIIRDNDEFLSLYLIRETEGFKKFRDGYSYAPKEPTEVFKKIRDGYPYAPKELTGPPEITVNFTPGIKKADGIVEQRNFFNHTFSKGHGNNYGILKFFERSELLRRKSELLPSDILTIACSLKVGTPHTTQVTANPLKLIELEKLSENFRELLANKKTCDTTLRVKEKEFQAHRSVLIARSTVFAAMFEHDMSEKQTGVLTIADCDPYSFGDFLQYLYTGTAKIVSSRSAADLYKTADKYDVQELRSFCVRYMKLSLTVESVCGVVTFAEQYEETELLSAAQVFFNRNMSKIFPTAEWHTLFNENYSLANKLLTEMASKVKIEY